MKRLVYNFISIFVTSFIFLCGNAQTWTCIATISGNEKLTSVSFCDSLFGMVTTVNNKIYITEDGGYNWELSYFGSVGFDHYLNDVKVLSHARAIAVGCHGTVLIYDGSVWSQFPSGTTKAIKSIYMYNDTIGFAAGAMGLFIKTVNGGITWTTVPGFTLQNINCIHGFGVNLLTMVAGESWPKNSDPMHPWFGYTFTSDDGGLTWTETVESMYYYNAVFLTGYEGTGNYYTYIGGTYYPYNELNGCGIIKRNENIECFCYEMGIAHPSDVEALDFTSPLEGYAVGANVLTVIKNGWYSHSNNPTANWITDVDGIADTVKGWRYSEVRNTAWAVGHSGTVLKYRRTIVNVDEKGSSGPYVTFYPNPASGVFHFTFPGSCNHMTLLLTFVSGEQIMKKKYSSLDILQVDLSRYPDGIYFAHLFISINGRNEIQRLKLVKIH